MRGLCVKTWTASQPISSARSIAFEMPPDEETWAPNSMAAYATRRVAGELPLLPRARLSPLRLQERDYRLLFAGDDDHDGRRPARRDRARVRRPRHRRPATDLGIVFAVRQGVRGARPRLRRRALRPAAAQPRPRRRLARPGRRAGGDGGGRPHRDRASVGVLIVALQAVYGVGDGLVIPAEVGLVPQTVSAARLQQANALQGMSRNMIGVLGPAVGGALVVAGSPGSRSRSTPSRFVVCAVLLRRIRVAPRADAGRHGLPPRAARGLAGVHLADVALVDGAPLRDREHRSSSVLDRARARRSRRSISAAPGPWAVILTAGGVGAVLGGIVAMRDPARGVRSSPACSAPRR